MVSSADIREEGKDPKAAALRRVDDGEQRKTHGETQEAEDE